MKIKLLLCLALPILISINASAIQAKDHNKKYNKAHGKSLPYGLQKQQSRGKPLPPGWQRKMQKGDILSPDIYSRATPVRYDDYDRYHVGHDETAVRIDGKVIRLLKATHTILEIVDE